MAKPFKPVEMFLAVGMAFALGACGSPAPEEGGGGEATESSPAEEKVDDASKEAEGGEGEEKSTEGGEGEEKSGEGEEKSGEGGEGGEGS